MTQSISSAIEYAANMAPSLSEPGVFISWAETISELLSHIYIADYEEITDRLTELVKEFQGYEDE